MSKSRDAAGKELSSPRSSGFGLHGHSKGAPPSSTEHTWKAIFPEQPRPPNVGVATRMCSKNSRPEPLKEMHAGKPWRHSRVFDYLQSLAGKVVPKRPASDNTDYKLPREELFTYGVLVRDQNLDHHACFVCKQFFKNNEIGEHMNIKHPEAALRPPPPPKGESDVVYKSKKKDNSVRPLPQLFPKEEIPPSTKSVSTTINSSKRNGEAIATSASASRTAIATSASASRTAIATSASASRTAMATTTAAKAATATAKTAAAKTEATKTATTAAAASTPATATAAAKAAPDSPPRSPPSPRSFIDSVMKPVIQKNAKHVYVLPQSSSTDSFLFKSSAKSEPKVEHKSDHHEHSKSDHTKSEHHSKLDHHVRSDYHSRSDHYGRSDHHSRSDHHKSDSHSRSDHHSTRSDQHNKSDHHSRSVNHSSSSKSSHRSRHSKSRHVKSESTNGYRRSNKSKSVHRTSHTKSNRSRSSRKSNRKPMKGRPNREKHVPYHPDLHCGVIDAQNPDNGPCLRNIVCAIHPVHMRRLVPGRTMTFDQLMAAYKTSKIKPQRSNIKYPAIAPKLPVLHMIRQIGGGLRDIEFLDPELHRAVTSLEEIAPIAIQNDVVMTNTPPYSTTTSTLSQYLSTSSPPSNSGMYTVEIDEDDDTFLDTDVMDTHPKPLVIPISYLKRVGYSYVIHNAQQLQQQRQDLKEALQRSRLMQLNNSNRLTTISNSTPNRQSLLKNNVNNHVLTNVKRPPPIN